MSVGWPGWPGWPVFKPRLMSGKHQKRLKSSLKRVIFHMDFEEDL